MTHPLKQAQAGDKLKIVALSNPSTALMAIRLGLCEGETIELSRKIPGGPFIILKGAVEIALGRELCSEITVETISKNQTAEFAGV